ncbi:unnamed protein product [Paramecium octaurelia]|uniref:Cyclic nucleotide-binding domain-containing protein n=1 Tax=Paramecium octaurelia TaxID=43137 RepID=A0A8S1VTW1_PAROT|nr:unnamed protein product [Paramecium octaurelia]
MSEQRTVTETSQDEEEQNKKKFIYQTEKLKLLLQVPIEQRTQPICKDIAEIAQQIKFLSQYKKKPDFLELCKNLYLKTYEKRQYIFKQGDQGDAFYVILNGSVKVYIDEPTEFKNFMQLKEIAQLGKGDAFGEISLLYNSKRTATVIANERSDLIVLEKDAFQEYMKTIDNTNEMKTVALNRLLQFLESLPVFQMFNKDLLVQLCTKCQIQMYPSQQILLKQGVEPTHMYIIKSGRVKAIKKIKWNLEDYPSSLIRGQTTSSTDLFSQDVYFEIDELGDGEIFGDFALLNEEESQCSYITSIPSEIVSISSFNLKMIVPSDRLEAYQKQIKQYPEDDDLKLLYEEKRNWNQYKRKLITNIYVDKQNKKGFDNRLRLPELKGKSALPPINIIDIKTSDNRTYFKYLESKISPMAECKKKVQSLTQVGLSMQGLVKQLEQSTSQLSIANSFQRKLKKLNINRSQ